MADGLIYDAMYDPGLNAALGAAVWPGRNWLHGSRGVVTAGLLPERAPLNVEDLGQPQSRRIDQNRAEAIFSDRLLTLYRDWRSAHTPTGRSAGTWPRSGSRTCGR